MELRDEEASYKIRLAVRILGYTTVLGIFQFLVAIVVGLPASIFAKVSIFAFIMYLAPSFTIILVTTVSEKEKAAKLLLQTTVGVILLWIVTGTMKQLVHTDESMEVHAKLLTTLLAGVWLGLVYAMGIKVATTVENRFLLRSLSPWPWLKLAYAIFSGLVTFGALAAIATLIVSAFNEKKYSTIEDEVANQAYLRLEAEEKAIIGKTCRQLTREERQDLRKKIESELRQQLGNKPQ